MCVHEDPLRTPHGPTKKKKDIIYTDNEKLFNIMHFDNVIIYNY